MNKKVIFGFVFVFLVGYVMAGSLSPSPVPEKERIDIERSLKQIHPQLYIEKASYVTEIDLSQDSQRILNTTQTTLVIDNGLIIEIEYVENKSARNPEVKKIYRIG